MVRKDAKPIVISKVTSGDEVKYIIEGGFLPQEEAWIPPHELIISSGGHDFLKLEKTSSKLSSVLGCKLVRNTAMQQLMDMRADACRIAIRQTRVEQLVTKDRVSKRAMNAWQLPNCCSITLPQNGEEPSSIIVQFVTDFRSAVCISLDSVTLQHVVSFVHASGGAQTEKAMHSSLCLGDGISYNEKRQRMWGWVENDDGIKRMKSRKIYIPHSDLQDVDKTQLAKEKFYQMCNDGEVADDGDDIERDADRVA